MCEEERVLHVVFNQRNGYKYLPGKLVPLYDIEQEQQLDLQQVQFAAAWTEQKQQFFPSQILLGIEHPCPILLEEYIHVALMKNQIKSERSNPQFI